MTAFLQINGTSLITHYSRETSNHKLITNKGYNIADSYLKNVYFKILHKQRRHRIPPLDALMHRLILDPEELIDGKKRNNHNKFLDENQFSSQKEYLTIVSSMPHLQQPFQQPHWSVANSLPKINELEVELNNLTNLSQSEENTSKLPQLIPPIYPISLRKKIQSMSAFKRKQTPTTLNNKNSKSHYISESSNLDSKETKVSKLNNEIDYKLDNSYAIVEKLDEKEKENSKNNDYSISNLNKEHKKNVFQATVNTVVNKESKKKIKINTKNEDELLNEYYKLIKDRKLMLIDETKEKYQNTSFKFLNR